MIEKITFLKKTHKVKIVVKNKQYKAVSKISEIDYHKYYLQGIDVVEAMKALIS